MGRRRLHTQPHGATAAHTPAGGERDRIDDDDEAFPTLRAYVSITPHEAEQKRALPSAGSPLHAVSGLIVVLAALAWCICLAEGREVRAPGRRWSVWINWFAWEVGKWEVFSAGQG